MRDGRVGEDPLHVPLHERCDVPPGERDDRDHRERVRPEPLVVGEAGHEQPVGDDQGGDLRGGGHERGHRRRRALVGVGRPHVEGRRRGLEREPDDDHRQADHEHRVAAVAEGGDLVEAQLARLSVDERGAEEERRRADGADDQVLQARLERADQVDVDRAEGVEADREPLERQIQRHQVRGLDEERHPGRRRGQQRVVLGDVLVAPALPIGDEDGHAARACDQDLRERRPTVAEHRVVHERGPVRALHVEQDGEDERRHEAEEADEGGDDPADRPPREHRHHQEEAGRAEQGEHRREREPVDVRLDDHLAVSGA